MEDKRSYGFSMDIGMAFYPDRKDVNALASYKF